MGTLEPSSASSDAAAVAAGGASSYDRGGAARYAPDVDGLAPSASESWNSGGTAAVLPRERELATFDREQMTNILDGGPDATRRRRWILAPLAGLDTTDKVNMTREELMAKHLVDFIAIHKTYMADGYIPRRDEVRPYASVRVRLCGGGGVPARAQRRGVTDSALCR